MKRHRDEARAGDLLALEALDPAGVAATADGALVRAIEASVKNPEVMSGEAQMQLAEGFGALVNRLAAGQSLQFYLEATPVQLDELLARSRAQSAGHRGRRRSVRARGGAPGPRAASAGRRTRGFGRRVRRPARGHASAGLRARAAPPAGAPAPAARPEPARR